MIMIGPKLSTSLYTVFNLSTIIQMLYFTLGLFNHISRHVLASLHFNENVRRGGKLSSQGEKLYRVTYPKYKLGEEVVREVTVPPTYGMLYD